MKKKISVLHICLVAMAVVINVVGGQIALLLHLPICLDCIGTILTGALLGPFYGLLPHLLSGIIMGMTTDIYSLYFAPVGMIVGLMAGLVFKKRSARRLWPVWAAVLVTLPGSIVSACICAGLFGGITSSGSTILVQLLAKTPLGMTASVFIVQFATDYLDRLISIILVIGLLRVVPKDIRSRLEQKE